MKIAVISLNKKGDIIAKKISKSVDIDLYSKTEIKEFNIKNITKEIMEKYDAFVFLSSTGIAVRSIAPYIKSKDIDPAVIVIDILGKYVISLLSGHLGGANALSVRLSEIIGALPVITTATDILKVKAPDIIAMENSLIIDNLKDAKEISALLVDGKKVAFVDETSQIDLPDGYIHTNSIHENLNLMYDKQNYDAELQEKEVRIFNSAEEKNILNNISQENFQGVVYVTDKANVPGFNKTKYDNLKKLKLIRRDIVVGVGCKKDYSIENMIEQVCKKLEEFNIDKRAVKYVATVEIKRDEKAILELNKFLKSELKIFTREAIKEIQYKYKGSDFVEKSIGIRAVCEPCVELCKAAVVTEKLSLSGMTLCIGKIEI